MKRMKKSYKISVPLFLFLSTSVLMNGCRQKQSDDEGGQSAAKAVVTVKVGAVSEQDAGKCRYCRAKITPRYFLVELLTAVLFLSVWLKYEQTWLAPAYWILAAGLIAALRSDEELFGPLAEAVHNMHFLGSMAPFFLSAVFAALGFFLLYRFLPNGSVSTRAAALAALPAALLWLASRSLFSVLVAGSSHYGQVYGPLAGAVVLLLWIYYTAYIMIFCAELGVAAQGRYWPKAGSSRPLEPV